MTIRKHGSPLDDAMDIPTMRDLAIGEYEMYIQGELLFVDHHGVLRSAPGQYPLAVTEEQLDALIRHLQSIRAEVGK